MKVKIERMKMGYSQKEFANIVGITPQYLRMIELDKIDIKRSLMVKIADKLNTTVQELFLS